MTCSNHRHHVSFFNFHRSRHGIHLVHNFLLCYKYPTHLDLFIRSVLNEYQGLRIMPESISSNSAALFSFEVDGIETNVPKKRIYQHRRGSKVANPVVSAILSSNNLDDCIQVKDLLQTCSANESKAAICKTAAWYFERCHGENS